MGLVIMLAIPFAITRIEARWTIVAMLLTFPTMMWLYSQVGYQRLLGLPHAIFWTPMVVWLWMPRDKWRVKEILGGKWVLALFAVMTVPFVMDYADVARYLMGERL